MKNQLEKGNQHTPEKKLIEIHELPRMSAEQEIRAREYAEANPNKRGLAWEWVVLYEDGKYGLWPYGWGSMPMVDPNEKPVACQFIGDDDEKK